LGRDNAGKKWSPTGGLRTGRGKKPDAGWLRGKKKGQCKGSLSGTVTRLTKVQVTSADIESILPGGTPKNRQSVGGGGGCFFLCQENLSRKARGATSRTMRGGVGGVKTKRTVHSTKKELFYC